MFSSSITHYSLEKEALAVMFELLVKQSLVCAKDGVSYLWCAVSAICTGMDHLQDRSCQNSGAAHPGVNLTQQQ